MEPGPIAMDGVLRVCIAIAIAATTMACAKPSLYQWGRYEDAIYDMYLNPGNVPFGDEIQRLEEDLREAQSSSQLLPPGLHAHLGYLYVLDGNLSTAMAHFET